ALAGRMKSVSEGEGRECAVSCALSYHDHIRKFSRMDPLRVWYTKISDEDFIDSLPKRLCVRIEKAKVQSGSEMDFPKLTGSVGGQIRITDQPPLIFHPEVTRAPEAKATLNQIFKAYRKSLADDRRMLLDRKS